MEYLSNLKAATEDTLTDDEYEAICQANANYGVLSGNVELFL